MRYIQSFSTSGTEQEAITQGLLGKPYVALILNENRIDWDSLSPTPPEPPTPSDTRLISTYNVTTTGNTRIFGSDLITPDVAGIEKIELEDGTEIPGGYNYAFSATGEQKVYVTLSVKPSGKYPGKQLRNSMYYSCGKLIDIYIPEGVTLIDMNAFESCTGLTSVTIPNSIKGITNGGNFIFCSGLRSVVIGSGIIELGDQVFMGCSNLTAITITATTPPTIGNQVLNGANSANFYVPDESVEAYKAAASWSSYASRVKGISERP